MGAGVYVQAHALGMVRKGRRRADDLALLESGDDERARSASSGMYSPHAGVELPLTIQVRATECLYAAERADAPTAILAMDALSSETRAPDMAELRAVWNLQRFAAALERRIIAKGGIARPRDRSGKEAPEEPARMDEWRRGVRKTTYLTLAVGAALAGVYQAPLRTLAKDDIREYKDWFSYPREPEVLAARWPALQTLTTPAQDAAVFGDLDAWLLAHLLDNDQDGRAAMTDRFARSYGRALTCTGETYCVCVLDGHSHADAHHVIWELIKMLWMAHKMHDLLDDNDAARRRDERRPSSSAHGRALVAPFRYFVTLSVDPDSLSAASTTDAPLTRVFDFVEHVNSESGQMTNYQQGLQIPPLWAKFFVYFLHRHFDLAFDLEFLDHYEELAGIHTRGFETALTQTLGLFSLDTVDGRDCSNYHLDDLCAVDFLSGDEILEPAGQEVTYY